jgi:hypothetical protein
MSEDDLPDKWVSFIEKNREYFEGDEEREVAHPRED